MRACRNNPSGVLPPADLSRCRSVAPRAVQLHAPLSCSADLGSRIPGPVPAPSLPAASFRAPRQMQYPRRIVGSIFDCRRFWIDHQAIDSTCLCKAASNSYRASRPVVTSCWLCRSLSLHWLGTLPKENFLWAHLLEKHCGLRSFMVMIAGGYHHVSLF